MISKKFVVLYLLSLVVAMLLPGCVDAASTPSMSLDDPAFLVVVITTAVCGFLGLLYMVQLLVNTKPGAGLPKVLPVDDFEPFPLIRKEILSHDTCRFTLGLPPGHVLGLPIGQHISLKFTNPKTGKAVQRSYTPVTNDTVSDEVQLVIKVYRPAPPKFPDGGLMSQHLDSLKIGDTILVKGPKGHLHYKGRGKFSTKPLGKPLEERSCRYIGMMAGGTGITPMLQILQAVLVHPEYCDSKTQVKLIYANQTPDDILVRTELEDLAKQFPDRFQLWYTVDRFPNKDKETWKYDTGFITPEMVKKHLVFGEQAKAQTQFFVFGPPPMVKFACLPALKELGFEEKNWSVF